MKVMEELTFISFKTFIFFMVILFFFNTEYLYAKIRIKQCSECHTMHNYQNNQVVFSRGPISGLLKNSCIGCHTSSTPPASSPSVPYVLYSSSPIYNFDGNKNILAGGNFYWVADIGAADYKTGHNVYGISGQDTSLTPPGFDSSYTDKDGNVLGNNGTWDKQLRCAGAYGCHGKHTPSIGTNEVIAIYGAHHTDDSIIDGSTVGKSYRFLYGVKGTEDSDWEFTHSPTDHNGYYAIDRGSATFPDKASINYLCAECHGDFHSNSGIGSSSPWLRHPVDYDLNSVSKKEYGNYPNSSYFILVTNTNEYFIDVPLGNTAGSIKSIVLQSSGDAIILCISCHKAHGSPYKYDLRWDYVNWPNGTLKNGCFACHTVKD